MENKIYYKITNAEEKHYDFQYRDGLNILKEEFNDNPYYHCCKGGLYFTDIDHIADFLEYGIYLREITLPINEQNFKMIKDNNKYRANMIILGKRYELKDVSTIKMLMERSPYTTTRDSLVWWNISNGCVDGLEYMINNGAKINGDLKFAIEHVSWRGYSEMLKYLLTKFNNLNLNVLMLDSIRNNQYGSELINLKTIQAFVEAGVDVHVENERLLINYAAHGMYSIVKYLIENGADIHAANDYALRRIVHLNDIEMVKYLIEKGANVHAQDEQAIEYAVENSNPKMVKYLLEQGANVKNGQVLKKSVEKGNIEIIKILLDNGSIIDPG